MFGGYVCTCTKLVYAIVSLVALKHLGVHEHDPAQTASDSLYTPACLPSKHGLLVACFKERPLCCVPSSKTSMLRRQGLCVKYLKSSYATRFKSRACMPCASPCVQNCASAVLDLGSGKLTHSLLPLHSYTNEPLSAPSRCAYPKQVGRFQSGLAPGQLVCLGPLCPKQVGRLPIPKQ